jgi:uncharacterized protein (DUF58 family)
LLFAAACLLELLGRLVDSTTIAVAAAAALGAVIGDAALTPQLDGVMVTRRGPSRMVAGAAAPLRFVMANAKRRHGGDLQPMLLTGSHPALAELSAVTPTVRRQTSGVVDVTVVPPLRGYWPDGGTTVIEARSPLGGFVRRRRYPSGGPTWVHPAPAGPIPLPDLGVGNPDVPVGSGRSGQGLEFFGIREWRSGDASSSVHWRASARRNQLVVMERERPADAALVIAVGTPGSGPAWEADLARAAATAVAARRLGRPVALLCGDGATSPGATLDVLDWFAEIDDTQPSDPFAAADAIRATGRGGALLWLSASPLPADLQRSARAGGILVVPIGGPGLEAGG